LRALAAECRDQTTVLSAAAAKPSSEDCDRPRQHDEGFPNPAEGNPNFWEGNPSRMEQNPNPPERNPNSDPWISFAE
jgi:hypothetical protein